MIDCDTALLYLAAADEQSLSDAERTLLDEHARTCEACRALAGPAEDAPSLDPAQVETVTGHTPPAPRAASAMLPTVDPATYEWGDCIGRGGMGKITQVRDLRLARDVAIKEAVGDHRGLRFEREALITARLQHPAIVPVYEAGTWPNGSPFYAMKMVAGTSLDQVIAGCATLDERIALLPKVIIVAEALAYAHAQRIVHRDLKPANVLVGEFGETVVIDWGLAKELAGEGDDDEPGASPYRTDAGLTVAGEAFGTPRYMPPEQALGEPVDERADVFSLGAILYHLLAGEPPYADTGARGIEVLSLAIEAPPTPIVERQPEAPPDLVAIVNKAMARDPDQRYANAGELAADLERFQAGQLVSAREYSPRALVQRWLRAHRTGVAIAAVLTILASVGAYVSIARIIAERNNARAAVTRAEEQSARATRLSSERQALLRQVRVEQGREELLAGRPAQAAAYLVDAWKNRDAAAADSSLDLMLAAVMPSFEARQALFHSDDPVVEVLFDHKDTPIAAVQRGDDLVLIEVTTQRDQATLVGVGRVSSLIASPGGSRVVTRGDHTTLWDPATGERVAVLASTSRRAWFGPDDRVLAVAEADGTVSVRDARSGAALHRLQDHDSGARDVAFHHGGEAIAVLDPDGEATVFDARGAVMHRFRDPVENRSRPDRIALGPEARYLLLSGPRFASLVQLEKKSLELHLHREFPTTALAVSRDGRLVAFGYEDGTIDLWHMAERYHIWESHMPGHSAAVQSLSFTPDGTRIISGSGDWSVRVWDARSGATATTLVDQPGGADWHPRIDRLGARVLVRSGANAAVMWSLEETRLTASLPRDATREDLDRIERPGLAPITRAARMRRLRRRAAGEGTLAAFAPSPGHDYLVTADSATTTVELWRLGDESRIATLPAHRTIAAVSFRPDGQELVTVDRGRVRVFAAATGRMLRAIEVDGNPTSAALSTDGGRMVLGDMSGRAQLWDPRAGTLVARLAENAGTADVSEHAFSPDGSRFITMATDGQIRLWNAADGALLQTLRAHDSIINRAYFHDDNLVVTNDQRAIKLWRASATQLTPVATIEDREQTFRGLAINRDGSLLATFGPHLTTVWDTAAAAPVARLSGETAAFSNDGTVLAAATDHAVLLWRLRREQPTTAEEIRRLAEKNPIEVRHGRLEATRRGTTAPTFIVPGRVVVPADQR